jgi:molecular chaperone Hsp33
MPGVKPDTIAKIETNIKKMKPISELIDNNQKPEDIINLITEGDHEFVEEMPLYYKCDCSKERFLNGLSTLDKKELKTLIDEKEPIEIMCEFCKTKYVFNIEELKEIYNE